MLQRRSCSASWETPQAKRWSFKQDWNRHRSGSGDHQGHARKALSGSFPRRGLPTREPLKPRRPEKPGRPERPTRPEDLRPAGSGEVVVPDRGDHDVGAGLLGLDHLARSDVHGDVPDVARTVVIE